jgi:hypothetical protein
MIRDNYVVQNGPLPPDKVVYSSNQFKLDPTEATAFEAKMQRAKKAIRKTFLECIRRELDTFSRPIRPWLRASSSRPGAVVRKQGSRSVRHRARSLLDRGLMRLACRIAISPIR